MSSILGTVRYAGGTSAWTTDSIYDLRVVAFENQPTAPEDIITFLAQQRAIFTATSLPLRVDSSTYSMDVLATPRIFTYVVVAMQNGPDFLKNWVMLSVYAPSGDPSIPGQVIVPSSGSVKIDFVVDFANLPPQPFK